MLPRTPYCGIPQAGRCLQITGAPWAPSSHALAAERPRGGKDGRPRYTQTWLPGHQIEATTRQSYTYPWADVVTIIGFLDDLRDDWGSEQLLVEDMLARAVAELGGNSR